MLNSPLFTLHSEFIINLFMQKVKAYKGKYWTHKKL